jgi:glycosyltransferase involved in cell wall biosynthesis
MTARPTCLVVTPVRNAEFLLSGTIRSVLTQTAVLSGRVNLQYVVVDGDSDDQTAMIARSFEGVHVISEPDSGMYDALRKGLAVRETEPTVCAYLNAGDLWQETALDVVLDVLEQRPDIDWLTGYRAAISPQGYYVNVSQPFAYRGSLIRAGMYGSYLPSIQQESTFWRGSLLSCVDTERLARFRLAGDHFLWRSFAGSTRLYVVCALLGGFRMHPGHLSGARQEYVSEMLSVDGGCLAKPRWVGLHRLLWSLPDRMKKGLGGSGILSYCEATGEWSPPADRMFSWSWHSFTRRSR